MGGEGGKSGGGRRRAPQASMEGMTLQQLRSVMKGMSRAARRFHEGEGDRGFTVHDELIRRGGATVTGAQFLLDFNQSSGSAARAAPS